jgi:uncharacterized RDD family membrane protein YckC
MPQPSQTLLLRLAAFCVDGLIFALTLIVPASVISYSIVFFASGMKGIPLVWWTTIFIFFLCLLFRDGWRGRSPGKRLLGLRVQLRNGGSCGYARSLARNFMLIVPLWNLLEVWMVLFAREGRRTGDRIAATTIVEE